MADKRISQLIERTDIANNDVLPIVASGATTTNKVTVSTLQDWMQDNLDVGVTSVGITLGTTGTDVNVSGSPITTSGNITINFPTASATNRGLLSSANWTTFNNKLSSVGLTMPSAFTVSNSPLTANGTIAVTGAGTVSQYVRGDGSLADFPQGGGGGGASVSYYLNGSVSQGTIGGIAYREMNKTPILGSGTDFTINANGYIASFITDAGDPNLLLIPGGNWNLETYFAASSGGGSPSFYVELYKVDSGGTATLVASNSANPELIAFGTTTTAYFSSLAVPATVLTLTDRLALRYYVTHSGRTITLHTENSNLCQIITTFTTGLTALNGLTAQVQNFATGTSGTDFNISSASTTHTFNLPDASASNRGVVTTGTQTIAGIKTFTSTIRADVSVLLAQAGTALPTDLRNISGTGLTSSGSNGFGFNSGNNIYFSGSDKGGGIISFSNTGNQTYTLQNASGTLAFTSDLGAYLPLAGGTLTGALGGTSLNFSGDIQTATRLISATSGQQILINANNGGSTNRVESVGTLPLSLVSAAAITMAAGGTTPQITLNTTGDVGIGTATPNTYAFGGGGKFLTLFSASSYSLLGIISNGTSPGAIAFGNETIRRASIDALNGSDLIFSTNGSNSGTSVTERLRIASTGAATFSSSVTATQGLTVGSLGSGSNAIITLANNASGSPRTIYYKASDATINFTGTGGSDQVTITNGGNVGIGTASPTTYSLAGRHLEVNDAGGGFAFIHNNTTSVKSFFAANESGGVAALFTFSNHPLTFGTNNTERMRITSGGFVLVNRTTSLNNGWFEVNGDGSRSGVACNQVSTASSAQIYFSNPNGIVGSIFSSGSATSYNTSSDYRLKENIKPVENALSVLTQLKPCTFNFIADADEEVMGFIAHEVQEVIPQAVTGEKDGFRIEEVEVSPAELDEEGNVITEAVIEEKEIPVYQGIDHSKLVPLLVAAIQELKAEIDSLKNQMK